MRQQSSRQPTSVDVFDKQHVEQATHSTCPRRHAYLQHHPRAPLLAATPLCWQARLISLIGCRNEAALKCLKGEGSEWQVKRGLTPHPHPPAPLLTGQGGPDRCRTCANQYEQKVGNLIMPMPQLKSARQTHKNNKLHKRRQSTKDTHRTKGGRGRGRGHAANPSQNCNPCGLNNEEGIALNMRPPPPLGLLFAFNLS